ncbi:esterase [Stenotrophomonas phage SOVA965]
MANLPSNIIPVSDLPELPSGSFDSIVGVNESASQAVKFRINELPVSNATKEQIDNLVAGQQTSSIYANTLSDLQSVTGSFNGQGGFVVNGQGSGQYRWNGSSWEFLREDILANKADKQELKEVAGGIQFLGNSSPAPGSGASSNANFILSSTPARNGKLNSLSLNARIAGTVNVGVYRAVNGPPAVPGSALIRVATIPLSVAMGSNSIDLSSQAVNVQSGDLIGLSGNGIVSYTTTPAGGPRYYSVSGQTPTLGNLINDNRWEFGIGVEFSYSTETPIGEELSSVTEEVRSPVSGLDTKASKDDVDKALGSNLQRIANNSPQVGTPYASGATIVCTTPVNVSDKITKLKIGSAIASSGSLVVYRPPQGVAPAPGVTVTRILVHPIQLVAGVNIITGNALPDLVLLPGDIIGISANGALTYTTVSAGGPRYYQVSGATATLGNPINDNRWEWGVEVGIEFSNENPLFPAVIDYVNQKTADVQSWEPTNSFILVVINGQSLAAGRALNPSKFNIPEGRSYKWNPTDGIVTLTDPTGTDTTALTGRSSIGPAIANAVLVATNGKVGVIIINTAIGSTTVNNWRTGGSAWNATIPKWDSAIADIISKKLNVIGTAGVVLLGETDANNGTSANTYRSGLLDLRNNMRLKLGIPNMPLIMSQLGINTDDPTSQSWNAIRSVQSELARNGEIILAYRRAKYFGELGWMIDNLHPNEIANDEVGGALGQSILAYALGTAPIEFDS